MKFAQDFLPWFAKQLLTFKVAKKRIQEVIDKMKSKLEIVRKFCKVYGPIGRQGICETSSKKSKKSHSSSSTSETSSSSSCSSSSSSSSHSSMTMESRYWTFHFQDPARTRAKYGSSSNAQKAMELSPKVLRESHSLDVYSLAVNKNFMR